MTSNPESRLFDFAGSKRIPKTEDEQMVTELHDALGFDSVPLRLRKPPAAQPARSWRHYFPVAAAVVLVIALLGASFSTLVPDNDQNDDFASVPPVVLGLVGEDSEQIATPLTNANCDLSGDIPFFSGIAQSPIPGPVVLLTPNEELVLNCGNEQIVLLTGVKVAGPSMTPHIMFAVSQSANHLLNVVTGKHIEIPNGGPQARTSIGQQVLGPWVLSASTNDTSRGSIYELTSMTEIPIDTEDGEQIEITELETAVVSSTENQFAIAVPAATDSESDQLSGFFFANMNGESRFVGVDDMPMPRQIAISPDGQSIATSSFEGSMSRGTTTITLLSTDDGEVTQTYDMNTRDQASEITWMRDNSTLLLTNGTMFLGITPDSPEEGIHVYATGENLQGIFLTPNDRVVAIAESSTSSNSTPVSQTLFVNIDTNAIVTQPGSDMWSSPNFSATRTTLVLAQPQLLPSKSTPSLLVVEAATGEVIGEIDHDTSADNGVPSSTWGYGEGDIVTLAFGPESMWLLVDEDGNATLTQIAPPSLEDAEYQAVSLVISPDGYLALRTFEPYSAWLRAPDTEEWIQIDLPHPRSGGSIIPDIKFILGDD